MPPRPQKPPIKLQVLIVGGGPVGLVTAAALCRNGHKVTVLERNPCLQARGGLLVVQPAAARALSHIGLGPALEAISSASPKFHVWSYSKGQNLLMTVPGLAKLYAPQRKALLDKAYEAAVASGAEVLFSRTVVELVMGDDNDNDDDNKKVIVCTDDGQEYRADLVIGADGLKSRIRKACFPGAEFDPRPTRECIFQTQIPLSEISSSSVSNMLEPGAGHATLGPGRFRIALEAGTSPAVLSTAWCVVEYYEENKETDQYGWSGEGDGREVGDLFRDFQDDLSRCLLPHVATRVVDKWRIAISPPLPSWRRSSAGGGSVLLLGDAAHAMAPHAGQGLSQGIESAVALAHMLQRLESAPSLPYLLARFEELRRPRVERFMRQAVENAAIRSLCDGPAQQERDSGMRQASAGLASLVDGDKWNGIVADMNAPAGSPGFMKWEVDYDVIAEVGKYLIDTNL